MTTLDLPKWFDLHTHFRQGAAVGSYIGAHFEMGCAGALAMPNTRPPVARVSGEDTDAAWSIESYRAMLEAEGAEGFERLIVPLYITRATTAEMIAEGAASGLLQACKYYPPHGTTNSEHGVPMAELVGGEVLRAMEEHGVVLCIHGEQHALGGEDYLAANRNAESLFYADAMPRLLEEHPRLRIVCEHITTKEAVAFVQGGDPARVGATVTPQHLLYTVGHLIQGLKYHLYCLPVVKFDADRDALRAAVTAPGQTQFFAGTDSAPHSEKVTECGCAAGCFTGGCAPQLYAMGFEAAGVDLGDEPGRAAFEAFLCTNGPAYYGFAPSAQRFQMVREPNEMKALPTPEGDVVPLPLGVGLTLDWRLV
jgi:dihydroorotase